MSPAATWQGFLVRRSSWCFGQITSDLATWDVHPPLYFWTMHIVQRFTGVGKWVGPAFNLVCDTVSLLLLMAIGRRMFDSRSAGLAAAALWAFGPAVLAASWEARAYPLLVMIALGTTRTMVSILEGDQHRIGPWVLLRY